MSVISGLAGADAQGDAADEAADAMRYAADQQKKIYEQDRKDNYPFYEAGLAALPQFYAKLGIPVPEKYYGWTPEEATTFKKYGVLDTSGGWALNPVDPNAPPPAAGLGTTAPPTGGSGTTAPSSVFYQRTSDGQYVPYVTPTVMEDGNNFPTYIVTQPDGTQIGVSGAWNLGPGSESLRYTDGSFNVYDMPTNLYTNPYANPTELSQAQRVIERMWADSGAGGTYNDQGIWTTSPYTYAGEYWGAQGGTGTGTGTGGVPAGLGTVGGVQMTQEEWLRYQTALQKYNFANKDNTGESPYAKYTREEATKMANRQYGARGLGGSGYAANQTTEIGRKVAADDWQTQYSRILDALKLGTKASDAMGAGSQSYSSSVGASGNAMANLALQSGNAQASMYSGISQNTMSGLGLANKMGAFDGISNWWNSGAPTGSQVAPYATDYGTTDYGSSGAISGEMMA